MEYLVAFLLVLYLAGLASLCFNLRQAAKLVEIEDTFKVSDDRISDWPALDILVPVKDEEENIGRCLESILTQDYPNARLIAVNDRSTDGTGQAIEKLRKKYPDLLRHDIAELPQGAYGKPHALHSAASELTADIVVFIDSDFRLEPGCLRALVGPFHDRKLDWLAVMGKPELDLFWERLLVPLFGAMAYAWYDPRKVSDPNWPDAIGSGFMLARREAYQEIGGHGCVLKAYDEDSELVRTAKRAGQKVSFVLTPGLFTLRLYGSYAKTVRGINRTLIGGLKTLPRFFITIGGLNFVSHLPIGMMLGIGVASWVGLPILWSSLWLGLAGLHLLVSTALAALICRTAGVHLAFAFLHPLGAAMMIFLCVRAALELNRREPITWRGTSYAS